MIWLNIYRECVKRLEAQSYTVADDSELDYNIDARECIQRRWGELTEAQRAEVAELDERFRRALIPALEKADLLQWYRRNASYYDASDWWWHVGENQK
ncbi:MAG TPA: hypothetical protein VNL69_03195 [Bacteroidota bacterium]|nr:hypothetical protein [Bacteroidota bacterium]